MYKSIERYIEERKTEFFFGTIAVGLSLGYLSDFIRNFVPYWVIPVMWVLFFCIWVAVKFFGNKTNFDLLEEERSIIFNKNATATSTSKLKMRVKNKSVNSFTGKCHWTAWSETIITACAKNTLNNDILPPLKISDMFRIMKHSPYHL